MAQLQGFIFGVWRFLQHRFIIIVFLLSSRFISGTFYISANLQLLIHSYRDGVEWCSVIGTTLRRKERSNVFSVLFIGKARNASASTPRIAKVTIVGVLLALSGISPESNLKVREKSVGNSISHWFFWQDNPKRGGDHPRGCCKVRSQDCLTQVPLPVTMATYFQ
ncbi:hypothetical protein J3Q64DRAFT_1825258 [Phycomyces blakesleeanus]|uniref:Uncharacterized protein n=1 Tax=Phycomyces blakesleeanus TaxID=4837 RepID=A0ABR3AME8_PHYBL